MGGGSIFAANSDTSLRGFWGHVEEPKVPNPSGGRGSRGWRGGRGGGGCGAAMFGEQQRLPGVTRSPPGPLPWPSALPGDGGSVSQTKHPHPAPASLNMSAGIFRSPGKAGRTNNAFAMVTVKGGGTGPAGAAAALFWFGLILFNCYFRINGLAGWGSALQSRCSGEKSFCLVGFFLKKNNLRSSAFWSWE